MRLGLGEILKKAATAENKEARINVLRQYDSPALRTIIKYAYDPAIVWDLPEGDPPYKPCDYTDQHNMLYSELRRLYLFIKGGNDALKPIRKETLFIGLLESVDKEDALLLLAMKDKKTST